jgi:hypothetical protein
VLTLDPDLAEVLQKGSSSPVYIVEIHKGTPSPSEPLKFCTGDRPLRNVTVGASTRRLQRIIPNIVTEIQAFGQSVDVLSRAVTMSDTDIVFIDDGQIRRILDSDGAAIGDATTSYHLFNSKISILLGDQSLDISKFMSIGNFTVSDIIPSEGIITLSCKSLSNLCSNFTVSRPFKARTPLTQLDQILRHTAALSDVQLDRASYDPEYGYTDNLSPTIEADKRHWAMRQDNNTAGDPEYFKSDKQPNGVNLWELVNGISYLTRGFSYQSENGKITYVPYVVDKAASKHLTVNDIDTFSQNGLYGSVVTRVTHSIKSVAAKTGFEPWAALGMPTQYANLTPIHRSSSTYFGGVSSDTEYTTKSDTLAQTFAYPDTGTGAVPESSYFWKTIKDSLDWCSGMASCSFLRAPTICSSGDRSMRPTQASAADSGTIYGNTSYTHSVVGPGSYGTLGKMVMAGPLNCCDPSRLDFINCVTESGIPIPYDINNPVVSDAWEEIRLQFNRGAYSSPGSLFDQSTLSDKTFIPIQSPVIRIVDTGASAQSDGVVAKEGLIARIDNSNGYSILWIDWRYDSTTEFTADFSSSYQWIILEPQFPIFPDLTRRLLSVPGYQGDRRIGIIPRPHGVRTHGGTYGIPGAHTNDFQRYFYIQHASLAGFSGMALQPNYEGDNLTLPKNMYRGPVPWMNRIISPVAGPTNDWGVDGNYQYGHYATTLNTSVGDRGQSYVAQLRPQERIDREAVSTGNIGIPAYAQILLEYNESPNAGRLPSAPTEYIKRELIKCNQAYFAADWGWDAAQLMPPGLRAISGALGHCHRFNYESSEPISAFTDNRTPPGQLRQRLASCGVFRAEASSVSIDSAGAIKPSGRGVDGTTAYDYNVPKTVTTFTNHYTAGNFGGGGDPADADPPNWFWVGIKATDVTIAKEVNQQILNRFSSGAPIVEITTSLQHIDLQIGDFITMDNDIYLRYERNGTDAYTVFEIVRKEVALEGDSPRITFELCWVRQGSEFVVPGTFAIDNINPIVVPPIGLLSPVIDVEGRVVYDYSGDAVKGGSDWAASGSTYPTEGS